MGFSGGRENEILAHVHFSPLPVRVSGVCTSSAITRYVTFKCSNLKNHDFLTSFETQKTASKWHLTALFANLP